VITFSETFCTRNLARAALSVAVMTLATPYRGAGVPGAPPPDPEVARFAVTLKYSRWRERAGIFLPLAFVGGLNVLPLAASPSRPHIAPDETGPRATVPFDLVASRRLPVNTCTCPGCGNGDEPIFTIIPIFCTFQPLPEFAWGPHVPAGSL
jgi:hypothetical protein